MECLRDYIGIRHCSQTEPKSGLYLNNLAGMTTELADKIATSEQVNFNGVWEDVQIRAFGRFAQDLQAYLFDYAKVGFNKTIFQTERLKKPRAYEVLEAEPMYRGVYLYFPSSRFVKVYIKSVQIFAKDVDGGAFSSGFDSGYQIDSSDLNSEIRIYDLQNEKLLRTIPFTYQQGINTIEVDLEFGLDFDAIELFICYDSTKVTSIKTTDNLYGWYDGDCVYYSSWRGSGVDEFSTFTPATLGLSETPTYTNLGFVGIGQGLAIDAHINCSIEQFICENKQFLKTPLLYLLGSEMLFQKLASNVGTGRMNWFTYGNMEQTAITRQQFESEYTKALKNAVRGLNIPDSGVCFACDENSQSFQRYSMP